MISPQMLKKGRIRRRTNRLALTSISIAWVMTWLNYHRHLHKEGLVVEMVIALLFLAGVFWVAARVLAEVWTAIQTRIETQRMQPLLSGTMTVADAIASGETHAGPHVGWSVWRRIMFVAGIAVIVGTPFCAPWQGYEYPREFRVRFAPIFSPPEALYGYDKSGISARLPPRIDMAGMGAMWAAGAALVVAAVLLRRW